MKIHLISDVHLEFQKVMPEVTAVGDVCVCAGDIGVLNAPRTIKSFFEELFNNFDVVIWVLGNHEYYHMDVLDTLNMAKQIEEEMLDDGYAFYFLDVNHNPFVDLDGVKFWGTTFWTNLNDWYIKKEVQINLNDYHVIKHNGKKLLPKETDAWNQKAFNLVNWNADVIITHHPPIYVPHPKFPYRKMTHAFYNFNNELKEKILDWEGKFWLYGHTHHNAVTDLDGTLVIANCFGYGDGFQDGCKYDNKMVLEV